MGVINRRRHQHFCLIRGIAKHQPLIASALFQVCAFAEDLPEKTLMVLQSYDAILDAERIARHALHRESADVLWVEGFSHGEILGPQGFEARKQLLEFIQNLDGK